VPGTPAEKKIDAELKQSHAMQSPREEMRHDFNSGSHHSR
jgi:hypothetical protein